MVELRSRQSEMRGDGGNDHEKWGLRRVSCATEFTILYLAGMNPDLVWNNSDTRSSEPNLASRIPNFSYPLVSSISFSHSSPIPLFLIHNSAIIAQHKVKSSLCISLCNDHELTPSCSIYRVQHTPSAAYTKCSIHPVQNTQSAACAECSIHLRLSVITSFWWLQVNPWMQLQLLPSLPIQLDRYSPVLDNDFKGKVTSSHSHGFESTSRWIES